MKVIIAGSRHMPQSEFWKIEKSAIQSKFPITEVVCGMARGADLMGREWALSQGIQVKEFPADWKKYGKAAGPIRNKQMGDYADALIALLYDGSRGTQNMIDYMNSIGKPVWIQYCSTEKGPNE